MPALREQAVRNLVDKIHNSLEGARPVDAQNLHPGYDITGHPGIDEFLSKLSSSEEWKEKFDFKKVLASALREYAEGTSHPYLKTHAMNILAMLLMSHTIETVGGGLLSAVSLSSDSWVVQAVGPMVGLAITVPGADPLCMFLLLAYKKSTKFRAGIGTVRVVITRGASALVSAVGIKALYNRVFIPQTPLERLKKSLAETRSSTFMAPLPEGRHKIHIGNSTYPDLLDLEGEQVVETFVWRRIRLTPLMLEERFQDFALAELKGTPWVFRQSLRQIFKELNRNPEDLEYLSFVKKSSRVSAEEGGGWLIEFNPALVMKPRKVLAPGIRKVFRKCREFFTGAGESPELVTKVAD